MPYRGTPYKRQLWAFCAFLNVLLILAWPVTAGFMVPVNPEHAWQAKHAARSLLVALDTADGQLVAAGVRGHILHAPVNGLDDWQQAEVEAQVLLTAIDMVDEQHGWAVGHDSIILNTRDAARTWQRQYMAIEEERPLLDVMFKDQAAGVAVGAYGLYLTTADGGKTWVPGVINEEHDYHLNAIARNDDGVMYIAAESGHVYRSDNDGAGWIVLKPPYEGSFFDVVASGDRVVVAGLRGHIFMSSDRGSSWQQILTDEQSTLTSLAWYGDELLIIGGHAGLVLALDLTSGEMEKYRMPSRFSVSAMTIVGNQLVLAGEHGTSEINLCEVFSGNFARNCR